MARRRRKGRSCAFESLEDRSLLAGDVTASILNGNLLISGDKFANGITLAPGTAANTVLVTGVNAGTGATNVNGTSNGAVTLFGFTGDLTIRMKGGNDNVTITGLNVSGDVDVDGGKGDDTFTISGGNFSRSLGVDLGKGADSLTITNLTVTGDADIHGRRGRDHVTITNSMFGSLDTSLGRGNDTLDITGTTVTSNTNINGGRGANTFNNGTGNTLNGLSNTQFGGTSSSITTPASSPTLTISGAASVNEGALYTLNLSASGTGASTITKWTITWGDGTAAQVVNGNPASVTHTFADGGASRTISATATNPDGTFNAGNTVAVMVNNVAPALSISGAAIINKGALYTLNLSASDPGADTISKWTISWGDGSAAQVVTGNPTSVTHTFTEAAATRTVSATATDEDGTFNAAATIGVSVNDFTPVLSLSGPTNINEGSLYTLGLSASGGGASAITSWTINWGDGSAAQAVSGTPTSVTHTFLDGFATRTISVTATNGTTTTSAGNTVSVTVMNVAPFVAIGGATNVNEGALYTLNLSSTDPGGADTISQWTINWGDNTPTQTVNGNPSTVTHRFADGNVIRTILATATDEDGTYAANSFPVIVNNVAPTLTISGASSIDEASTYTLNLSSSDPGADTIQHWTINWGDGLPTQTVIGNPASVTHVFPDGPATRTISATATDEDDTFDVANTVTVTVGDIRPVLSISGPATIDEGNYYTLNLSASDVGTDTIDHWSISWGDGSPIETVSGNPESTTHVFADGPNLFTVSAAATNEDGTFAAGNTVSVTVQNVPPSIPFSGPTHVSEGVRNYWTLGPFYFNQGDDTITEVTVHWGDGQVETYPLGQVLGYNGLPHAYDDGPNTYTITIDLVDEDGTFPGTATLDVSVGNVGPSVTLQSPNSVFEGGTATIAGTYYDPGRSDSHTLTVEWGDPNDNAIATFEIPGFANSLGFITPVSGQTFTSTSDTALLTITSVDATGGIIGFSVSGHVYQDDGATPGNAMYYDSSDAKVTVTDSDGETGSQTVTVYVNDLQPTISLDTIATISENDVATLSGSYTDAGQLDAQTININWGDPNYAAQSMFAIPAIHDLAGNATINIGDMFSSSTDSTVLTITAIDAATGEVHFSAQHRYLDDGQAPGNRSSGDYNIINVTVTDDDGAAGFGQASFIVNNALPTIALDPVADVFEGSIATLSGTYGDVGLLDGHSFDIYWSDVYFYYNSSPSRFTVPALQDAFGAATLNVGDTFNSSGDGATLTITSIDVATREVGFAVEYRYRDDGWQINYGTPSDNLPITIYFSDDDQEFVQPISTSVTVHNVPPTVHLDAPLPITEGDVATLTGTFSDVGGYDSHTLNVDWGDDNSGSSYYLPSLLSPYSGDQNLLMGNTFYSYYDNSTLTITSVDLDTRSVGFSVQHRYLTSGSAQGGDSGLSTVSVTVSDDDGDSASDKRFITINNAAPVVVLDQPEAVLEMNNVTITGSFTDPGLGETHSITVNWGDPNNSSESTFAVPAIRALSFYNYISSTTDNAYLLIYNLDQSTGQIYFQVQHTYLDDGPAPGNGTTSDMSVVQVTVADDGGLSGTAKRFITVNDSPPAVGFSQDFVQPLNATIHASYGDNALDGQTLTIDWGQGSIPSTFTLPARQNAAGAATLNAGDTFNSSTDSALLTVTVIYPDYGYVDISVGHQFTTIGPQTITIMATDDDGGSGSQSMLVYVVTS